VVAKGEAMRIRCGYCEKQTASIICCADEAALCSDCDLSVHAANKLAGKHQRVSIIQQAPTLCDVCKVNLLYWVILAFGFSVFSSSFNLQSTWNSPTRLVAHLIVWVGEEPSLSAHTEGFQLL
jgi:hypothetical protein